MMPDDPCPIEPEEPGLNDCCGNGCEPCVFDTYIVEKRQWEQALKEWETRQVKRRKPHDSTEAHGAATCSEDL